MDPWRVIGWFALWFIFFIVAGLCSIVATGSISPGFGAATLIGFFGGGYLVYRHYRRPKSRRER